MENSAASTPPINGYAGVSTLTPAELDAGCRKLERRRATSREAIAVTAWSLAGEILLSMAVVTLAAAFAAFMAVVFGMMVR
jgi:hypothetical protein